MAAKRAVLVSDLKYVWDNYFTKKNRMHLILCGSVGSFLVKKIIHSKALYGRIDLEINLKHLKLPEIREVFRPKRSLRDVAELYMALGGVPQYLELVEPSRSVRENLQRLCFSPQGFLVDEFERIFASHFGTGKHYRKILVTLAKKAFSSRGQLEKACRLGSGGRITGYLDDLVRAGLIEKYASVDRPNAERIVRYRIADPYLLFYFRFIQPSMKQIKEGTVEPVFSRFVKDRDYDVWCGLAFEFVCLRHAGPIAEKLGFSAVNYRWGSWFSRASEERGTQIDLLFVRADRVITLCEGKFQAGKNGKGIIDEVERKRSAFPNPKNFTVETVLITASPPTEDLLEEGYFSRILRIEDLFGV